MEADPLCDSGSFCGRLQEAIQKRIGPGRHFALHSFAGEDPVLRLCVASFPLPGEQFGSGLVATMIGRIPWMGMIGAGILAWTAGGMIEEDAIVGKILPANDAIQIVPVVLLALVVVALRLSARSRAFHPTGQRS